MVLAAPLVQSWPAFDKLPDERVKTAKFILHIEKLLGIDHRGSHLQAIAHDTSILQQRFYFICAISGNACRIEIIECGAIMVALAQNSDPAQARLSAFQNQEFEEGAVILQRPAPFLIVILPI